MINIKIKLFFAVLLFFIVFFITSLFISLSFIDVPEDSDSLDTQDILDLNDAGNRFHAKSLRQKFKRVQAIELKKLKQTHHCRFQCKPAIDYYESGVTVSLKESDPGVRILIVHCLHCLKSKGFMTEVRARSRRKRDLLEQIRITPNTEPTKPMIKVPLFRRSNAKCNIVGGRLINVFHSRNAMEELFGDKGIPVFRKRKLLAVVKHKEKHPENYETPVFRKRKLFSAIRQKTKESEKGKVIRNQKKAIVVGQQYENEEYENNYEDNFDRDVPDLAKQAQNTQDAITYFLIGSFAFFALLFMFVFPVGSFMRMCLKNYNSNLLIVSDVLCYRDPKYRLVKEMCDKCDIPIPDYSLYRKLMKYYEAKDAETAAKEKALKETTTDESDSF